MAIEMHEGADAGLLGLGFVLFALALSGIVYCTVTIWSFHRFFARPVQDTPPRSEGVSILKPLCGMEPRLEENLRTFFEQDHAGPVQILCGYADPDRDVSNAIASLASAYPMAELRTVVSAMHHGPNAKVSNLINLHAEARHPIVVFSDSDMAVGPDYLGHVLGALAKDGVGAVSLLYRGRGDGNFWSTVAAAGISYQFLPNAVFGVWSRLASPCMGSTIAIRQDILERIGPLRSFAGHLADDYAIGAAVRRDNLLVEVPPHIITHACTERSFLQMWRHEVRWGATVRSVVPLCYLGSVVTFPLPLAILGTLASGRFEMGGALVAMSIALRSIQMASIDRQVGAKTAPLWFLPFRDCLSFAVFVASLFATRIDWRGRRHAVHPSGQLAIDKEIPA